MPLRRAVRLADKFLFNAQAETPDLGTIEPTSLRDAAGHLRAALGNLDLVLEVVEAVMPRGEEAVAAG